MAKTVMATVNVKTMELVLEKMAPAAVPRRGGLGCCVISPAQLVTLESTALRSASVKMGQLVIP